MSTGISTFDESILFKRLIDANSCIKPNPKFLLKNSTPKGRLKLELKKLSLMISCVEPVFLLEGQVFCLKTLPVYCAEAIIRIGIVFFNWSISPKDMERLLFDFEGMEVKFAFVKLLIS
jgi:hypothetical protein